jgi:hypothetical protein
VSEVVDAGSRGNADEGVHAVTSGGEKHRWLVDFGEYIREIAIS